MQVRRRWALGRRRRGGDGDGGFALRTVDIHASRAAEHPDLLARLERQEIDAILLRHVLSAEEVERALKGLQRVREECGTEMFGHVLGLPLLRLGDGDNDRERYYEATRRARQLCEEAFGFDPHERCASVFVQMADGLPVEAPSEDGHRYNPGTVRWYLPGQGGLYPHVGNEFVDQNANGALDHLLTLNQIREWMSWFMVLQRPETGGTLTVYDLLYEDRPPEIDLMALDVHDPTYRSALFESLDSVTFDPGPGDVIVFCGGWRYHRIEDIGGTRPRITYGGFMRPDRERRSVQVWA